MPDKPTVDWDSLTTKKHLAEAEAHGCVLVGPGSDRHWRLYRLACGHQQEITLHNMRQGDFRCRTCHAGKLTEQAALVGCTLCWAHF